MSRPKFESEWDGFKGHVALTWDRLSNDELLRVQGDMSELVKLISDTYGEKKHLVEEKVNDLYDGYLAKKEEFKKGITNMKEDISNRSQAFADSLKQKATDFQTKAKDTMNRIRTENIDPALQKSEDYIKVHPFTAVLGAFGVGILIGGLLGFLSRKD